MNVMTLRNGIRQGFRTLSSPEKAFKELKKRTFEDVLEEYIKLLLLSGFLAALALFLINIGRSFYLHIIRNVTVDYWGLLNYSSQASTATFFFYLFAGTFLLFVLSLLMKPFFRGWKLVKLLGVICYSVTPLLFFSWIYKGLLLALGIWSLFLLVIARRA